MAVSRRKERDYTQSQLARIFAAAGLEHSDFPVLIDAFLRIPRELFVEPAFCERAYEDNALPIGHGQTISKPSTVLAMLAALELAPGESVLEIGSGSGYVTAVLAAMGQSVYAMERIGPLAQLSRARLDALGFQKALVRVSDGMRGWVEHAPYDAILVSAAVTSVSAELLSQLSARGRLLAPVISADDEQRLLMYRVADQPQGRTIVSDYGPCRFVLAS